jgi:dTDP-4-dehydrorhamnose reductase
MKPAILLIGANGQVGRELKRMLPILGDVTSLDRRQLDLRNADEIRNVIRALHPVLIVNAAAYTNVDKAESDRNLAHAINAQAPAVMAQEAKKIGASVIHYSTDYVFDGLKTSPYTEEDAANPQNVYGKTKLEGDLAIQESGVPYLIFRVAWVYSTEGRNFLLTILRLATQREELRIVGDQFGAPTRSKEIAKATTQILLQIRSMVNDSLSLTGVSGVYHMTAAGETTWFEFAETILEQALMYEASTPWFAAATNSRPLIAREIVAIPSSEYPTPAHRPSNSILSNERLVRTFSVRLPDWQTQLHSVFGLPQLQGI